VVSLALLMAAGMGMSVHSLLWQGLVAELVGHAIGRQRTYSTLMIAINIAATVSRRGGRQLLGGAWVAQADPDDRAAGRRGALRAGSSW
jgi:hypothetical protein